MFDIGFLELLIVAVVALLVLGPERLPVAIKTTAIWVSRIKRSFNSMRTEIERELKVDEIRQDIHNASVMDELKRTREELTQGVSDMRKSVQIDFNQSLDAEEKSKQTAAQSAVSQAAPSEEYKPSKYASGRKS